MKFVHKCFSYKFSIKLNDLPYRKLIGSVKGSSVYSVIRVSNKLLFFTMFVVFVIERNTQHSNVANCIIVVVLLKNNFYHTTVFNSVEKFRTFPFEKYRSITATLSVFFYYYIYYVYPLRLIVFFLCPTACIPFLDNFLTFE